MFDLIKKTLIASIFVLPALSSFALPVDEIDTAERVFSIGDIHGDYDALEKIVETLGLYSSKTKKWTGGKSHLVFTGDLLDRGSQSKQVMDFVMELEAMAEAAGGGVHTLLGNHELLVQTGRLHYVHINDIFEIGHGSESSLVDAFRGDAKYAKWFRNRNAIIRINDTVFVHAGLEDWALKYSISEINQMVNQWVRFFQGVGPEPSESTEWVLGDNGPLWSRKFAAFMLSGLGMDRRVPLDRILEHFHAKRVAVGHTIVEWLDYALNNPIYGNRVIMTDSGISAAYRGELSGFEYRSSEVIGFRMSREDGQIIRTSSSNARQMPVACRAVYAN